MVPIVAQVLLFFLLTGMAASVDIYEMRQRLRRCRGVCIGLVCQFCLLPFLGFLSVSAFDLQPVFGLSLLAVTASPGGAYSNWWCSLFNADLALSVAMTTCSTLLSLVLTPANMVLYMYSAYGTVPNLHWGRLISSIAVAFSAICFGLSISSMFPGARKAFNKLGNIAGLCLVVFSAFVSSSDDPIWDKEPSFYIAVATPCCLGVCITFPIGLAMRGLSGPEAVAVTVETCYQNTGLALTVALSSFEKGDRATAAGVPLFYGGVQVVVLPFFMFMCWKAGLTHAKPTESLWRVLFLDHQLRSGLPQVLPVSPDEGPGGTVAGPNELDVEDVSPKSTIPRVPPLSKPRAVEAQFTAVMPEAGVAAAGAADLEQQRPAKTPADLAGGGHELTQGTACPYSLGVPASTTEFLAAD